MSETLLTAIISGAFGMFGAFLIFAATNRSTSAQIEDHIWERARETLESMEDEIRELKSRAVAKDKRIATLETTVKELQTALTNKIEKNGSLLAENKRLRAIL